MNNIIRQNNMLKKTTFIDQNKSKIYEQITKPNNSKTKNGNNNCKHD